MLKLGYVLWTLGVFNFGDCSMDEEKLIRQLRIHEGVKQFPYKDSVGKWTIGVGRNLTDRGVTMDTVDCMLKEDIELALHELDSVYPDWKDLSENRQLVLANMMFNMGAPTYLTFVKFWSALRQGDWEEATVQMLDSRWAGQVGNRARELSALMREG